MNFYKKIYSLYLSEIEEAKPGQDDAIMNTTTREMSSNGLLSFKTLDGGDEDIYEVICSGTDRVYLSS